MHSLPGSQTISHNAALSPKNVAFIGSWWSNAFPRGQWSADFLKVTAVLGGREKQVEHRILRPVPKCVLCVAGNFDEVSHTDFNPLHLFASFNKHLNIARKNEEDFDDIVAVHGYHNAGRDRSFQYARGFVALLRAN